MSGRTPIRGSMGNNPIVIFDGVCNLCNGAVNFIIRRDAARRFVFASVQSDAGKKLMSEFGFDKNNIDTFILIKEGRSFVRTDAALEIARDFSGFWHVLRALKIIPRPLRDYFYNYIATNRYKLFGKRDSCMMPTSEIKNRFL